MASHPPIPILELADHIERLKANDNLKFSQEYEVIHFFTYLTSVLFIEIQLQIRYNFYK